MKKVFWFLAFALGLSASVANAQRTPVQGAEIAIPPVTEWTSNVQNKCFCCGEFYNLPVPPPIIGATVSDCNKSLIYSTTTCPGANITWSISPSLSFSGQGTNSISIAGPINPGSYTITLTIRCGNKTVTNQLQVIIREDKQCRPDFLVSVTELPNGNYQVNANPTPPLPAGVYYHAWILEQVTGCPGTVTAASAGWNLYYWLTPTSSNPAVTGTPGGGYQYPGLGKGRCYKLTHWIYCCGSWKKQSKCFCLADAGPGAKMNLSESALNANTVTEEVQDSQVPAELKEKLKGKQ